ncbi:MAG TPA: alpha/beta hydrolase [Micromonosporaceae bacterium]|jgi:pimeloyl-ACP methyl ester carboxylesterase
MTRLARCAVPAIVLCLAAAACGSGGPAHHAAPAGTTVPATPSASAGTPVDPLVADGCSTRLPERVIASGYDRITLLGTGNRTVILSDESDENMCSWLPFAGRLVSAGYRVALWDYVDDPVTELAAVAAAVRTGRLALIGASEGAKTSLIAAVSIKPAVAGVVSLSAEQSLQGTDVPTAVAPLRVPVLLITAHDDAYDAADAGPEIIKAMAGTDKRLTVVPGSDHGTALLTHPTVTTEILAFLNAHEKAR